MDEKFKEFKRTVDNELKDIIVSEELKKNTLEKCRASRVQSKKTFIAPMIATATAAMIGMIIFLPNFSTSKTGESIEKYIKNTKPEEKRSSYAIDSKEKEVGKIDKRENKTNEDKKEKIANENDIAFKENSKVAKDIATKGYKANEHVTESANKKDDDISTAKAKNPMNVAINVPSVYKNEKNISENKSFTDIDGSKIDTDKNEDVKGYDLDNNMDEKAPIQPMIKGEDINADKGLNKSIAMLKTNLNIIKVSEEEAKNILKDDFKLPSYVPENFKIDQITIPKNKDQSNNIFEIQYSSSTEYFSVVKLINQDVKSDNAEIIKVKDKDIYCIPSGSDNFIILRWNYSNYMYEISGNVSKQDLIKVAESLM